MFPQTPYIINISPVSGHFFRTIPVPIPLNMCMHSSFRGWILLLCPPFEYNLHLRKRGCTHHIIYNCMARKTDVGYAKKNCALCSHIIESTSFKDNEGNTYNIQGSINCKNVGVIYCILCTECEKIFMSDKLVISFINDFS